MRIALDLMGAETPPEVLLEAIIPVISSSSYSFDVYFPYLISLPANARVIPCTEYISMEDSPKTAIRSKPSSSLVQALKSVQNGDAQGLITCCNTAALVLGSHLFLEMMPQVHRPALMAEIALGPNPVYVLDVGGAVQRSVTQLVEWAYLGISYAQSRGVLNPRVGLLNIGVEGTKGALEHRQVLEQLPFMANAEPYDVLNGTFDVIVTDGFSGNILLKSFEAASIFWLNFLPEGSNRDAMMKKMESVRQHGALLLGYTSYVMKCHGLTPPHAFKGALTELIGMMDQRLLERVIKAL